VTYESDLLRGLEWVELNKDAYHIRAVNLSVSSGAPESYAVSPVDAAVEHLWSQNVTVVAAAGNLGKPRTPCGTRRAMTRTSSASAVWTRT
jgi:hypothetical protein